MDKSFRIVIYTLLVVASIALGQKEELIEFEFKVFGVGSDSYDDLFYFSGKRYLPLKFHKTHRSVKTYQYRGPKEFSIYVRNPDLQLSNPNSLSFLAVAQTTVMVEAKRLLIILSASQNNRAVSETERSFNLFAINDDKSYFSRNTIVVLNTTGAELFGRVADTNITLPIGASKPINYKGDRGSTSETNIALALETDEGARLVMSNDIRLSNNRRVLLILEPPRRPGSFRIAVRKLSESIFLTEEDATLN